MSDGIRTLPLSCFGVGVGDGFNDRIWIVGIGRSGWYAQSKRYKPMEIAVDTELMQTGPNEAFVHDSRQGSTRLLFLTFVRLVFRGIVGCLHK